MRKYLFVLTAALLGTHPQESLGYQASSKLNLQMAKLAVLAARRVPVVNQKLEAKLSLYRQWHLDLKSARTGQEFNTALDNVERDLDLHTQQVAFVIGKEGPLALKGEIQRARVDVQRGNLEIARQRVERAVSIANQIDLNI